jgi:hypothetical protein
MAQGAGSFAELPRPLQRLLIDRVAPSDPDAFVRQPLGALGGLSFLDALSQPDGENTVHRYLDAVASLESSWTAHPPAATTPDVDLGETVRLYCGVSYSNMAGLLPFGSQIPCMPRHRSLV